MGERASIESEHFHLLRFLEFPKSSDEAETRIVDENVHFYARASHFIEKISWRGKIREIFDDHAGNAAGLLVYFGSEALERRARACHKNDVLALASAKMREFASNSRRSAGDEGRWHVSIVPLRLGRVLAGGWKLTCVYQFMPR